MRTRQFSDVSIAESCIDTHRKSKVLIKRKAATNYLKIVDVDIIFNNVLTKFEKVDIDNILYVTEYLYNLSIINKRNPNEAKTIIIELLSEMIDNTFKFKNIEYLDLYRPILKHIIPQYMDKLYNKKCKKKMFHFFSVKKMFII